MLKSKMSSALAAKSKMPSAPASPTSTSGAICTQLPPWVSVGHCTTEPESWAQALVTMEHKLWPNGSTITYSFLYGQNDPQWKETVNSAIAEYQRYANINFKQLSGDNESANIRIALKSDVSRSAIGIDALKIHAGGPTMKLDASLAAGDRYPLALHVIGHALGLMHEEEGNDKDHSNFPSPDEQSIMSITTVLNPRLSDSDKAWLAVNYPGRDATIDGTTWTLMYSLGVLQLPAHTIASILTSSDVSKKRDLYTGYVIELYEHNHVKERVEVIKSLSQDGILTHTEDDLSVEEPPSFDDVGYMDVSSPDAPPPSQPEDDEFSESVAAAVMHPQFRAALSNVVQQYINDNAPKLGINVNAPKLGIKPQPAAEQHFLGALLPLLLPTAIDLVSKLTQSGIQPNNIQPESIGAAGRVLSPAEQQVMNGFFASIFGSPVFKSVLKGVVTTITDKNEE